jgi:hypothetical protein
LDKLLQNESTKLKAFNRFFDAGRRTFSVHMSSRHGYLSPAEKNRSSFAHRGLVPLDLAPGKSMTALDQTGISECLSGEISMIYARGLIHFVPLGNGESLCRDVLDSSFHWL